eukprot:g19060.t1
MEVSSADALQARIRALCASGRAELVQEVPPDAWRLVPPVCIEPARRVILDTHLFQAGTSPAAGPRLDGERSVWLSPDGSGKLVRLQLLLGRSLAERLGGDGLSAVVKRLRPMQLVYVAGRLQLEEPGEQCGKATPAAPTEVRKIREAQLSNGIVDMAEQTRRCTL